MGGGEHGGFGCRNPTSSPPRSPSPVRSRQNWDFDERGELPDVAKLDVVCSRITMHVTSSIPPPKAPREPEDVLSREVPQETCEPHDGESESDPEDRLEVTRLDGRSESSDRKGCEPRTSVSSRGDSGKGTYRVDCS